MVGPTIRPPLEHPSMPNTVAKYFGAARSTGMSVIVESTAPDGTRFYELYGHLGPGPLPAPDTEIVAGEPIPGATIGTKEYVQSTMRGLTSGPHLHREIISGRFQLNKEGGLGLYSSEIEHKADPDTFDINHPVFPYEHGEPLPSPVPPARSRNSVIRQPSTPSTSSPSMPDAGTSPATDNPPLSRLVPGMPIPGSVGPTSIGGPNGGGAIHQGRCAHPDLGARPDQCARRPEHDRPDVNV
jgi:hypothetical protein